MKKVSVIILNWNGRDMLKHFLPSVLECSSSEDVEVVVADNCSDDGSCAMLAECFPSVKVLRFDDNYGFAEGYNKAIKEVDSEYVVLLNSDVEVEKGWLNGMVSYLDNNSVVAACQPKIRSFKSPDFFEHAGACGGFIDKYGYPFCRGRIFDNVEKDLGQYDSTIDVFWATGAALCIRRNVYLEVGGLDSEFFAHMEEIDLCWRLRSRGYRIVCVPECVVRHVGGATLNVENPRKTFLNFRNNLLMLYKNLREDELRKVFFIRFFMDILAAAVFVLKGKFKDAKAVIKAINEYRKIKSSFFSKREHNLKCDKGDVIPEIYKRSIVAEYNIFRKKLFKDLKW